jgi:uncharacterized protein (TIGR03435 family)
LPSFQQDGRPRLASPPIAKALRPLGLVLENGRTLIEYLVIDSLLKEPGAN